MKAVVFDIDNTIYPYEICNRAGENAMMQVIAEEGKETASAEFEKMLKIAKKYVKGKNGDTASSHNRLLYSQNLGEQLGVKNVSFYLKLYDAYWKAYLENMKLYDGVKEVFAFLKVNHIKIGFCTDLTAHIQFRKILQLGIEDIPDAIVTSEEVGREKPAKIMFELISEKLAVAVDEILMVGDSFEKDVQGALIAGMDAVLLDVEDKNRDKCKKIVNYEELMELLKGEIDEK